jgi:hypothetical protein
LVLTYIDVVWRCPSSVRARIDDVLHPVACPIVGPSSHLLAFIRTCNSLQGYCTTLACVGVGLLWLDLACVGASLRGCGLALCQQVLGLPAPLLPAGAPGRFCGFCRQVAGMGCPGGLQVALANSGLCGCFVSRSRRKLQGRLRVACFLMAC